MLKLSWPSLSPLLVDSFQTHQFSNVPQPPSSRLIHEGQWWASLCSAKGFQKFDWRPPGPGLLPTRELLQGQLDDVGCFCLSFKVPVCPLTFFMIYLFFFGLTAWCLAGQLKSNFCSSTASLCSSKLRENQLDRDQLSTCHSADWTPATTWSHQSLAKSIFPPPSWDGWRICPFFLGQRWTNVYSNCNNKTSGVTFSPHKKTNNMVVYDMNHH